MRLVLRKYYLLLVCAISLFTANNSLQAQNVLDQAGLTSATPAVAAYATRKLSSSYTGAAVRIRRQSDNAVADVAFDANSTISANSMATFISGGTGSITLGSFAAATNAFVSIWYDQSGNGRNATQTATANQPLLVSNGVVVTSSVLNSKATLSFNGSAQFMDLPMSSSIINAAGTISAVQVQPVLQSGFNAVVAWSLSGGTKGPGFGPLNTAGAFGLYTTWGPNNITLGPVAINQAYVLNATWSGNGSTVEQSRNGTIVSGSLGSSFNYTGNAWIGRDAGAYYNGNLAELIVSNTTITAGNRTALETNQNNAYVNAGALNFDGSNDYVNLGNILGASYTKEAWVNISNAAAVNNFISGGASSQHAFWAPNAYGNKLSAGHNEIWNQVQDPTPLVVGQWYHVAVTYDAATTTMKLYKNGVLVSSNNAVPAYGGGGNVVLLGAYDLNTNLLAGTLDETRIWSRVLCQTEIQNNMNAMLSGTQTGLTAYYKFNQGITGANNTAISSVTDASGNNRNGTMVGFNNTGATSNWVAGILSPTAVSPVFTNPPSVITGSSSICVNATTTLTNASTGTWLSSNTAVATISAAGLVTGVSAGSAVISFTNLCGAVSSKLITVSAIPTISITNPTPNVNLGNSATLTASSNLGKAIQFNGTNSVEMSTGVVLPNTFTQEAWIFSTSGADNAYHGFLGNTATSTNGPLRTPCMYVFNGNTLHGGFGDGTQFYYYITQPGVITPNTWYHVAQTFDGTVLKCFVNGVEVPLASVVNNPAGKTPVATPVKTLGKLDNNFIGTIDEVRMWNVVRTPAQLLADMNKGVPVTSTGLVAYWKLDEGTGTSTYDIKQGTVGTLIGSPVWVASIAPIGGSFVWTPTTGLNNSNTASVIATPTATNTYTATVTDGTSGCAVTGTTTVTVFDQPATALALDGANDYVKVADNASLDFGANDFTVETWTLKQANSVSYSNSGLVGKWNTGALPGTNEWILNNTSNGTDNLPAFLIENGTSFYRVAGTTPMILNQWYHLAAVKKGALLSLYVNGVLAATTTIPANTVLNNVGRDLLIGAYSLNAGNPTIFSSAKLDELRIWNRALCLSEINNNRNGELTGTQTGLVAYYKFNQGFIGGNNVGISTLTDASGNNNNGTIFNFASTATGNWVAGNVTGNSPTFVPATAPITGTTSACIAATSTLANANQGTWSSSNNSVATVNASGVVTAIAAGTTTITFTNTCGGISTTTFTVNPKPTASISTVSPLTVCLGGAVLLDASTNASPATYQWFRNGAPIPTATNASFNAIVSGSYTVVVSNANGCVSNTSNAMLVTVEDIIKPFFSSGGTVTSATNAQGQVLATSALGAVVTYNAPVGADNCTVVSNVLTAGFASGSVFPIGTTTVTYTVTDGAGLTETSSFDVVVVGQSPSLTAPANITVNNDEGQCGATVNFAATGSVGVPAATITYTEDGQPVVSGSSFAIGVHSITATATNAVGTSSVSFTITVVNTDHPTITAQGPTNFCEDGSVTLTASEGSSYMWSTGETTQSITVYAAGTYSAVVNNAYGCPANSNEITTTTITLPTAPEITGVEQVCANSSTVLTSDITGGVWTSANESIATVDEQGKVTGVSEGSVQIMYSITNESGCTSIGYFTVYVKPLPFPGVITGVTDICVGGTSRLDVTNLNGRNDDRSRWTTSNASVVTIGEFPSGIDINGIGLGTATITKTLTLNGCSAVIATAVINVRSIPIFTVIPENKTVYSITNQCNALVNYLVEATGVNTPTLTYSFTGATTGSGSGTGSGLSFNVGVTNVTITATNQCGSSNLSFTVMVTDIQDPVISAPANITVNATSAAGAMVTYVAPVGTDNCSATTVRTAGLASGSTFPIGVTTVTYTVTDASGNTASASFTVTVSGLAPVVVVPANISVNNIKGQCNAIVNFAATETTGIPASTISYTENGLPINSGATLAVGTHTITATATNAIGSSSKTFTVTVVDNEAPGGGNNISFPAPALALANIPEAANYNLVYALDVPNTANFDTHAQVPYSVNNAAALANTAFNRVAYLVDLGTKWVWVSFDKITSNLNEIGIPADYVKKQAVSNMNVFSSANAGVTNGTNIATGNVEFWSNCYATDASNPSIPTGNNGKYDFNDNNNYGTDCYGSFQVHNYGAGQTIFAYNSWSNNNFGDLGIGNQVGGSGHPDWTFASNAGSYSVKKIYVFVSDGGVQLNKPTINLDANGHAVLAVSQVDPGITDNCAVATRVLSKTSFDCTNLGANTVSLTVTDIHGNVYTGNTTVTVVDNIAPTITCPSNVVVNAASAAGAIVNYAAPVGTDNCSATTVMIAGLASGSTFPIGVTTVRYQVTDASGNSVQCSFTVTVNAVAPVVVVPANITVNVDENTCGAAVSFAATDNTGIPASTITYTENGQPVVSGASFSTGVHTIIATASNVVGSSSASFTITVIDNQLPVISAPANISVIATSAQGAMVTYVAPVGTDNCSATTVRTAGLASGSTFPIGVTTVTYTVTDASGNTASASFTVTVSGLAPVIVAPENITQNNDAGQCGASVSFAATETTAIPASTITYTENGQTIVSGHFFSVGTHTITATATNAVGSSSADFTITVIDAEKPTITVAAQTQSADAGVCKALVTVASPVTADNCAVASVVNNITGTNNASAVYPVGTTTITWTVTDIHGNITRATQDITVKDEEKPIVLTQNITVQLNASGAATITAAQINNGSTDNCGIASITIDKTSFYCSNVGANTVTLTVTDIHGNVNTATAVVTVQDKIAPVALAKNITVGLSAVGGTVSITALDVNNGSSDACGIASMTVMPSSFSCANIGANTVTLTVTDNNGNVSSTTAIVTVVDDKGPVPTAVLPVISGQCYATALTLKRGEKAELEDGRLELDHYYLVAPTAFDNCSGLVKGTTTDPLTYYNQGTYIIHWKFVDARGNVTIQEQTVIVKDTQAPRPKYASLPTITGQCSVSIVNTNNSDDDGDHEGREGDDHEGDEDENHYDEHQRGAPWAKDNCSGWIRGTTTDPLTYSVQGTYIIHWTFNDGHGNISTQTQTVIVADVTKPKIKAPNDKTVTCGSNTAPAVMGTATATDNCSVPVISYTDVNSGTQIVRTWRATDAAGNFSTDVQVIKLTTAFSGTVVSVPTSTVYTGGEVNNLYLGYGAQGTALTVTGLPSSGAPYTYSWTGVATNRLSATNTGAPVFSPIAGGVYTFTVTMTNKNGCSNTASISICVTDIRVPGSNGALVYVCHKGNGKTGGTKTLEVPVAQVASHIQTGSCGGKNDRLGSCDQNPCNSGNSSSAVDPKQLEEPIEVKPELKAAPVVVEELKVVVMPNPTTTYFTIRLESKDKAPVNLRVMDGSGRVIDAKQKMEPNSSFQMGHGYSSGTYYAEFIQGNKRKVIQLIKGRG